MNPHETPPRSSSAACGSLDLRHCDLKGGVALKADSFILRFCRRRPHAGRGACIPARDEGGAEVRRRRGLRNIALAILALGVFAAINSPNASAATPKTYYVDST